MSKETSLTSHLDLGLKSLVNWTVTQFGLVVRRHLGNAAYDRIETLRTEMARLRTATRDETLVVLKRELENLRRLSRDDRRSVALAFALMLETINVCENAYRSHRLSRSASSDGAAAAPSGRQLAALTYVLTAHPTEARAPANITAFHVLQHELIQILRHTPDGQAVEPTSSQRERVNHAIEVAWQSPLVRERQPRVKDEAENIYSNVLRDEAITAVLDLKDDGVPISLRTWVGGDKDGHPGVDETVMLESLTLSRARLLEIAHGFLRETRATLELVNGHPLQKEIVKIQKQLSALKRLKLGDAKKILGVTQSLKDFCARYEKEFGSLHPSLHRLKRLCELFPALVIPLELRESSDVLMSGTAAGPVKTKTLAIVRMLRMLEKISRGGSPLGYARGLIVSMTEKLEHLEQAARFQKEIFGTIPLPVIPLFEEAASLADSPKLVQEMIDNKVIGQAAHKLWKGQLEIMVGYSDSAKEAGVLASRMAIAKALPVLEDIIKTAGLTPIFFHGSGGSVDRGGGSIEDQTAWWPRSALDHYKVTIQGEMVERSFSTRAITLSQIRHILMSARKGLSQHAVISQPQALQDLAHAGSASYRERITSPEFLELVEKATPYMYLSALKIGSRPTKRATQLQVSGLRAIPWILCWTQSRILFPTWWGVGHAWTLMTPAQKKKIRLAFASTPAFTSYVKALGFTLAKIEFAVWQLAIEQSTLTDAQKKQFIADFATELGNAKAFFFDVTGEKDFVWFRPWLADSIHLRSAMIHPLNLLQFLAEANHDTHLLRLTVTGISSGMMTTG